MQRPTRFMNRAVPSVYKRLGTGISLGGGRRRYYRYRGESTRPGSSYICEAEELERVIPLIEAVRKRSAVPLSVDTRKAAVMKAAFKAGATLCNDISALTDDPALGTLIAEEDGAVVLMHKRGTPPTMQQTVPQYRNVISEVRDYLEERAAYALSCGIARERIIIDYGIGFGKTAEDNYRLIAASACFIGLGYPLLVGLSRKSFIGAVTGCPPEKRLAGTLAATMYAVRQGHLLYGFTMSRKRGNYYWF